MNNTTKETKMEFTQTNDAMKWAEAFVEHKNRNKWSLRDIDEGLMVAWFAGSMYAQECFGKNIKFDPHQKDI